MDGYFLIARHRVDNSFLVLKLNEKWFLGNDDGRNVLTRINDLEAIDLVTTRFSSEKEMAERMAKNGYISDSNVDIFIASKKNKDGKNYIKFDEVIYNPKKNIRISGFRKMAYESLKGELDNASEDLFALYDDVITKSYFSDYFYNMVMGEATNIPQNFVEQLRMVPASEEIPYDLKRENDFGVDNYYTIRSIVDALNRFDTLDCISKRDVCIEDLIGDETMFNDRLALIPELFVHLGDDYIDGQISLFSFISGEIKDEKKIISKGILEKTIPQIKKIVIPRKGLTDGDKQKEIYRVLRTIPKNTFYKDDGNLKVNYSLFKHPLLDEERRKLDTYLTGKLPKYFDEYISNYANLVEAPSFCASPYEMAELQMSVEYSVRKLDNRFRSAKCLNMAYEWCMLYDGCRKRDAVYEDSRFIASVGEESGKTYRKQ